MAHKYLREVNPEKLYFEKIPRKFRFVIQKIRYGFDERECYGLDETFYCWLYERLRRYEEDAIKTVDLEFHKFEYKGKTYTQLELIHMMLDALRLYFSKDGWWDLTDEETEKVKTIGEIWAIVLPTMWW